VGISRREALKAALALPAVAMGAAALPVEAAVAVPASGAVCANYITINGLDGVYKSELIEELRGAIEKTEFKHPGGKPYGIEYWLKGGS
jgi:hypothetical protein